MQLLNDPISRSIKQGLTYKVPGKGTLTTEGLFKCSLSQLADAFSYYKSQDRPSDALEELDPDVGTSSKEDREVRLKIEVIKAVYGDRKATKEANDARRQTVAIKKEREALVAEALQAGTVEFIKGLSPTEAQSFNQLSVAEQDRLIAAGLEEARKELK